MITHVLIAFGLGIIFRCLLCFGDEFGGLFGCFSGALSGVRWKMRGSLEKDGAGVNRIGLCWVDCHAVT